MKNLKLIGFLMILASSLMFIQCTTDTIVGPAGADGTDGINGTNGTDGTDGTNGTDGVDGVDGTNGVGVATCVACHSDSHRAPIEASYALSFHSKGLTEGSVGYAGGRGSCSRCHSNEGFLNFVNGMPAVDIDSPTPISCVTCHGMHGTFDFQNDGYDHALRTFEPVTLMTDATVTIDTGDKSNLCLNCHQSRRAFEDAAGDGTFKMTSSHWGPHHGPQANLIYGIQGAELTGTYAYPNPGTAVHLTGIGETKSSCVVCHMGESTDGTDGGHSWLTSDQACLTTCHTSGVPTEVGGLATDMATLATLLENVVGWEYQYEEDANGDLVKDANGDYILVLDTNSDPVKNEAHAIVHDGHPNNGSQGRGATFTLTEGQAAWNYLYVLEDMSGGVHNPAYAKALIKNSIEALQ